MIKQGQQVLLPGIAPVVTVTGHKEGSERRKLSIAGQHHAGTSDSSGRWHESRERLLSEQQASALSLVSVESWFPWQQRPT